MPSKACTSATNRSFLLICNLCIHEMIAASIHLTGAPALKACGSMPPTPTRTRINIFIEEATEETSTYKENSKSLHTYTYTNTEN